MFYDRFVSGDVSESPFYGRLWGRLFGKRKIKVLFVDDEPSFTRLAKLTLEQSDQYEVCVLNEPADAFGKAVELRPDIIFLDILMPGKDGGELRKEMLTDAALADVPIVFLTALVSQKECADGTTDQEGQFFLSKPTNLKRLQSCIEFHLRR